MAFRLIVLQRLSGPGGSPTTNHRNGRSQIWEETASWRGYCRARAQIALDLHFAGVIPARTTAAGPDRTPKVR